MRLTIDTDQFLAAARACDDSPFAVRAARAAAGLTQAESAAIVDLSSQARWQAYENTKPTGAAYRPGFAAWQLYLLLTGQHPAYELRPRG